MTPCSWRTDIPMWEQGLMRLSFEWMAKEGLGWGDKFFRRIRECRARAKIDSKYYQFLYRMADPERAKRKLRESYAKHAEQRRQDASNYRARLKTNPVKKAEHDRKVLIRKRAQESDVNFLLRKKLRTRINMALKHYQKAAGTVELLGCSLEDARTHLERQFTEGMTWQNYGRNGWHIDHIRPCREFVMSDPEQQKICFHYTNLRPMWESENCGRDNAARRR